MLTLTSRSKELQKAAADTEKQVQNSASSANKEKDSETKRQGAAASAQAQKAADKAHSLCVSAADKLPAVSAALHEALQKKAAFLRAEDGLKQLEDAARNVQEQGEEEEEEDEEDEALPASETIDDRSMQPPIKFEDAQAALGAAKQSAKRAQEEADEASLIDLYAAAKEACSKAAAGLPTARGGVVGEGADVTIRLSRFLRQNRRFRTQNSYPRDLKCIGVWGFIILIPSLVKTGRRSPRGEVCDLQRARHP